MNLCDALVQLAQGLVYIAQENMALRGQDGVAPFLFKEGDPQLLLQQSDGAAESGLRNIEAGRRLAKMFHPGQNPEIPQLIQRHDEPPVGLSVKRN